jgi:hypothetical protein
MAQKEKGLLQSQESEGWMTLKMFGRSWVLEIGEKYLRIETPGS